MHKAQYASTPKNLYQPSDAVQSVGFMVLDLHLNQEALQLAQRRILTRFRPRLRDQSGNIHAQIAPRREEDQAIDGLIERGRQQESGQDEEDAHEGEDGRYSLCNDHHVDLLGGQTRHRRDE